MNQEPLKRRVFLKNAVVASSAAAVATATQVAQAAPVETSKPTTDESKGYHVTDHIKAYYKTAAF